MHRAWLERGPGPVQEVVASIIFGPGRWDGWHAKWNKQYAQWAPENLGALTWPFRCLMDRDDITARLAGITCPTLIVHRTADAAIPWRRRKRSGTAWAARSRSPPSRARRTPRT
jgi:pimeloyl-ACP methyl ester carboxylesterase